MAASLFQVHGSAFLWLEEHIVVDTNGCVCKFNPRFLCQGKKIISNRTSTSAKKSIIKEKPFTPALKEEQSLGVGGVTDAPLQERN